MKKILLFMITIFLISCETAVIEKVETNGEPEGPHTSVEWRIWAYSTAAPSFIADNCTVVDLSLIHISEPTRQEARLAAISASAAIKCEYCIKAQVIFAKKAGLTDDEIKAAVQIAAEVARFSTLLYGNEFTDEEFNKALEKILSGL